MINVKKYHRIIGNTDHWDEFIRSGSEHSSLPRAQKEAVSKGYRQYELFKTKRGWSIINLFHSISGKQYLLGGPSLEAVLRKGIDFMDQDPENRELIVKKDIFDDIKETLLEQFGISPELLPLKCSACERIINNGNSYHTILTNREIMHKDGISIEESENMLIFCQSDNCQNEYRKMCQSIDSYWNDYDP
jgi:hypothetical protein